jgi:hypothetical protein
MQHAPSSPTTPLARIALETPPALAVALSVGARLAGAVLAAYIAADESYDRTQVFATGVAALAVLSLVAERTVARSAVAAFAAGVLFFAGAAFLGQTAGAGAGLLLAGVCTTAGALTVEQRDGRSLLLPVTAFFAALAVMVPAIALMALIVEG